MQATPQIPPPDSGSVSSDPFSALFASEKPRLWKLVRFRMHPGLRRRFDQDDVLQDVYLEAARRYDAYLASDYPSAYLWMRDVTLQTLHNLHRNHLTAQLRDAGREMYLGTSDSSLEQSSPMTRLVAVVTTPSRAAIRNEVRSSIRAALARLGPADHEVIRLRQFEELSNEEVSHVLEVSAKAASIRYVRALGRLKRLVDNPSLTDSPVDDHA